MRRFGQLVGTWAAHGSRLDEATGEWAERDFTWIVQFILDGRAVQDVEVVASSTHPSGFETVATAVRVYDQLAGAWRVSYFAPTIGEYCHLIATPYRNGLRQDGTGTDGRPVRWNFTSITEDGYTWEGWVSDDEGTPGTSWSTTKPCGCTEPSYSDASATVVCTMISECSVRCTGHLSAISASR